jgi:hypothetical protein
MKGKADGYGKGEVALEILFSGWKAWSGWQMAGEVGK